MTALEFRADGHCQLNNRPQKLYCRKQKWKVNKHHAKEKIDLVGSEPTASHIAYMLNVSPAVKHFKKACERIIYL